MLALLATRAATLYKLNLQVVRFDLSLFLDPFALHACQPTYISIHHVTGRPLPSSPS